MLDAPTISSDDYPECGADGCASSGGVDVPGTFTFTTSDTDVVKFTYSLNNTLEVTKTVPPGTTSTTVTLAPDQRGLNQLAVTAWDAAGDASTTATYYFSVAPNAPATGGWSFDEGSGSTAADSAGSHPATLVGGASWSSHARLGKALDLDGTQGYASAAGAGPDTSRSFTVSAWARPTGLTHDAVAVSEAGADGSAFALSYSAASHAWVFSRDTSDSASSAVVRSVSTATPVPGVWTHLTGVYNAQSGTVQLYVNGVAQGAPVPFATPWQAGGDLQIGRGRSGAAYGGYFPGQIDEIQTWDRALSPKETADLEAEVDPETGHSRPALAADWELNEASGSAATDSSGYGHTAALSSGAAFATDNDGGKGGVLSLDGTSGHASASGPLVDGQGDFTIAAWVRLDASALSDTSVEHTMRIAGQSGGNQDSWGLWYTQPAGMSEGMWAFGRTDADTPGATTVTAPTGIASAQLVDPGDDWTLVTGVYDGAHHQLLLYVDGVRQTAPVTFDSPWQATGDFTVGVGRTPDGSSGDATAGLVDAVRVWTGVTDGGDIDLMYLNEMPIPL
ncbi:LamG domain-containing protein [Streptomyces sp. NPDC090053]|uniref:LamG domain-containing protein n=1 Tax=Streptomyces sp. NPDC090053 TaxID=3365932 RepID=UPI0037FB0691